ncbi:NADH-quinone oxidoreductase subunit C [Streptomyces sp. WMMB 714]|uniref:NADH-quinone oxidoreductase subunit C n=1 Tax=Streptomyces sp. WMMB 714 TaxID=1286822 RepID=UPI0005F7C855|nr:NADH-quinone oxidoreductase subunit C [Streptomyces sp. WMMB 714]
MPRDAVTLFGEGAHAEEAYGVLTVDVPPGSWISALETARDRLGCRYFDWLSAVDEPGTGFRVCAHVVLLPAVHGLYVQRLLLRTAVPHEAPVLPTATPVYAGAAWHERETHEMFGVEFTGHPGLTPLLLPEAFEGHPLRKDFVLAARVAKAWPGAKEPGESEHGGPKRRQMLPPGVPDPNEWGPLKGQLPPVPSRPARGRAGGAASGRAAPGRGAEDRPVRRSRSASAGSASQRGKAGGAPESAEQGPEQGSPREREPRQPGPEAGKAAESQARAGEQAAERAGEQERQSREGPRAEGRPAAGPRPAGSASEAPWHDARPAFGGEERDGGDERDAGDAPQRGESGESGGTSGENGPGPGEKRPGEGTGGRTEGGS